MNVNISKIKMDLGLWVPLLSSKYVLTVTSSSATSLSCDFCCAVTRVIELTNPPSEGREMMNHLSNSWEGQKKTCGRTVDQMEKEAYSMHDVTNFTEAYGKLKWRRVFFKNSHSTWSYAFLASNLKVMTLHRLPCELLIKWYDSNFNVIGVLSVRSRPRIKALQNSKISICIHCFRRFTST